MSCGQIALQKMGYTPEDYEYYASEIHAPSIKVTQYNFPNTTQLGDVTQVSYKEGVLYSENGEHTVGKIDLILAGSPCQGFSMAGKQLAFDDERSKLYFIFERILKEIQAENANVKFLLENVKMKQEYRNVITKRLGVEPITINSNLVSAQNRHRLYWTNALNITKPEDKEIILKDILQENVQEKYYIKEGRLQWLKNFGEVKEHKGYIAFHPIKAKMPDGSSRRVDCTCILQWPHGSNKGGYRALDGKTPALTTSSWESNNLLLNEGLIRKLIPEECEVLQTVPVGYTSCVSDSQRYKMLGNGWTVDVIVHILKQIL